MAERASSPDSSHPVREAPSRRVRVGASSAQGSADQILILGDPGGLAEALAHRFDQLGVGAVTLGSGPDSDLTEALLRPSWAGVTILTRDDALALRLTLLCARVRTDLPVWVTLFDRTLANRVQELVHEVHVVMPSELVASELADHCVMSIGQLRGSRGVRVVDDALRLMVMAGSGLAATLVVQTAITMLALPQNLVDALYFSTRSVATVADVPRAETAPDWFKLSSTVLTVLAVVLVAIFTAALVRRLSRPRLTTLWGRRRVVSGGHAIVVGFGQIGFRLAQELQVRGLPVLALERDDEAPCVRLARRGGVPVAIGRGDDREILELAGVRSCAVVAAVTSDDLANVAIGLAASDVRSGVPLVLRLGDGNVARETDSLLHLGRICDAHDLTARTIAESVIGLAEGLTSC